MRGTKRIPVLGALGLCVLCAPLVWLGWMRPSAPLLPACMPRRSPPPPLSSSEAALRQAGRYWMRAQQAVIGQREALAAWDPGATASRDPERWRQERMAWEHSDDLRWAREAARQAAALARTPADTYRAAELLTRIEHDSGHHAEGLQEAEKLLALAPRERESLMVLRRAAKCTGQADLERFADARLRGLTEAPGTWKPR